MYMKLNVLILCKPQVTSDLYSGKKDLCRSEKGEGGAWPNLVVEQQILFSLPEV